MLCTHCGNQIPENSSSCPICGQPVTPGISTSIPKGKGWNLLLIAIGISVVLCILSTILN